MIPGACSNPTPHPDLAKGQLLSLHAGWYLLAEVECELLISHGTIVDLDREIGGRFPALELGLRRTAVNVATSVGGAPSIARALKQLLDAVIAYSAEAHVPSLDSLMHEKPRAGVPSVSQEELAPAAAVGMCREILAQVLFGLVLRNDRETLERLPEALETELGRNYPGSDPIAMFACPSDISQAAEPWMLIAAVAGKMHRKQALSLLEIFLCGVRLFESVRHRAGSNSSRRPLCQWIANSWL